MKTQTKLAVMLILPILLVSLACAGGDLVGEQINDAVGGAIEGAINEALQQAMAEYGFDLPIEGVSNVTFEDGSLNMQVEGDFATIVEAIRLSAESEGLTEQETNSIVTDTTASLIFGGHESGQNVILQMVDLGGGLVNVNIRFESP
jgi:hypothetical protein